MENSIWQIIVLIILIILSGLFSASETSLMSLSKIRLRRMLEEKVKGAEIVHKLLNNPNKLLGTILVGNNIVNIGASALATSLAIQYFGSNGVGIATGIMTILVLIFGEITPKSLAAQNSERISLKVAKPLEILAKILNPVIAVLTKVTNFIIRLFGGKPQKKQPFITEEELKTIVNVSHEEGVLEGEEKKMIYNVFAFGDSQVKDVMTPRMDITAVEIKSSYGEIIKILKEEQYSRMPVFKNTPDNIVGILYVKDLVLINSEKNFNLENYIRKPFFTYEFKGISELFSEMRAKRISMAVVIDEYGGTAGIVTIEDLVEEIVGEIADEYDEEENDIEVIKEDEYVVDGSTRIDVINEMLGIKIESSDFDSIGGYVIGKFGRFPKTGETVEDGNIKFIIEEINRNRVEKIKIIT